MNVLQLNTSINNHLFSKYRIQVLLYSSHHITGEFYDYSRIQMTYAFTLTAYMDFPYGIGIPVVLTERFPEFVATTKKQLKRLYPVYKHMLEWADPASEKLISDL